MADGDLGDLAPAMEIHCADDKSVPCGAAWSFDPPTVITNACGNTNVTFTYTTVTNSGPCPLVITRTWLVGDICGNTNTCSQIVTVVDTTPPVFTNCPANMNLGCNPTYIPGWDPNVRATDNCGPTAPTYLFVSSCYTSDVKRYNATTGAFIDNFASSNGLAGSQGMAFGPDGNLCVSSFNTAEVKRYHGTTGAFIDSVGAGSGLAQPAGLTFGSDGNLYVSSVFTAQVKRFNGITGAFMGNFVPTGSGGLYEPAGLVFGPDGSLYVSGFYYGNVFRYNGTTGAFIDNLVPANSGGLSGATYVIFSSDVKRYDGKTGTFKSIFVSTGSGGLVNARDLAFGPDGNLYVSSFSSDEVERYNGNTGLPIGSGNFMPAGSGGLNGPDGLSFGPDGNLYVGSIFTDDVKRFNGTTGTSFASGNGLIGPHGLVFGSDGNLYVTSFGTDEVKCYAGPLSITPAPGTFIDTFVSAASNGGLDGPTSLTFSPTSPVVTCTTLDTTNGCARTRTLTYTAVDSCGNSNTCTQVITWAVDTTPPVIACPANIVVASCTNVAVSYSATATDNCCSNVSVVFTPPSGTVFAAGTTTIVHCVATDCCNNTNSCDFTVTVTAPPETLSLFNTGVGPNGGALTTNPNGVSSNAFVITGNGLTNTAISKWIGPLTNGNSANGTYVYQITFHLPCTNNAIITGQWAVDNSGTIQLNGNPAPVATIATLNSTSFTIWHPFAITTGLVAGQNTLRFSVTNDGVGPTALRVELSGSATCCCYPLILESAATVTGPYAMEAGAVVDQDAMTITVAKQPGSARFYRIKSPCLTKIVNTVVTDPNVVLTYQFQ